MNHQPRPVGHYHKRNDGNREPQGFFGELWDSFWNPPSITCPKCQSATVEYYDPFFFSPVRALSGKRRVKCATCHFIWRPSRRKKSFLKGGKPFF
jgi:hypothetical protein